MLYLFLLVMLFFTSPFGVPLHLTSCSFVQKIKTGQEPSVFAVWKKTRTLDEPRNGSLWMNEGARLRGEKYPEKYKEVHGEDSNPETAPFDPEVAVLAGEGQKNGRLWIGHGSVDPKTVPSMRQVRRGRTSDQPAIETRPRPSVVALEQLRVCSSSVIYVLLHVLCCNVHHIMAKRRRRRWPLIGHAERRPSSGSSSWSSRWPISRGCWSNRGR